METEEDVEDALEAEEDVDLEALDFTGFHCILVFVVFFLFLEGADSKAACVDGGRAGRTDMNSPFFINGCRGLGPTPSGGWSGDHLLGWDGGVVV